MHHKDKASISGCFQTKLPHDKLDAKVNGNSITLRHTEKELILPGTGKSVKGESYPSGM